MLNQLTQSILNSFNESSVLDDNFLYHQEALLYYAFGYLQGKQLLKEDLVPSEFASFLAKGREASLSNTELVEDRPTILGFGVKPSVEPAKKNKSFKGFTPNFNKLKSLKHKSGEQ